MCIKNGWRYEKADEHMEQQDVSEFFTFLMDIFNGPQIELKRRMITEEIVDSSSVSVEKIPFIPLSIPADVTRVDVKDMLHSWLYDNCSKIKTDIITENGT